MVKEKSSALLGLKAMAANVGHAVSVGNQITCDDVKLFEHLAYFKGMRPAHLHCRLAYDVPGVAALLFADVEVPVQPAVAPAAPQEPPAPEPVIAQPAPEPAAVVPPVVEPAPVAPQDAPATEPAPSAPAPDEVP